MLAVPVLVYVLGLPVQQATTSSLVIVTAGAVVGGLGHARERLVCGRHAVAFTIAALPGVIAGTALGQAVSGTMLIAAFEVIMLAAAAAIWRKANDQAGPDANATSRPSCPPLRLAQVLIAGLLLGTMTGFFGVGGGFLIVPTLAIALTLSMRRAVGTSLMIIAATAVLVLIAHLIAGRALDVGVTTAMTAACFVGALAGVRLAGRVPRRRLRGGFAALVVLVASYILVSVNFLGGPAGA